MDFAPTLRSGARRRARQAKGGRALQYAVASRAAPGAPGLARCALRGPFPSKPFRSPLVFISNAYAQTAPAAAAGGDMSSSLMSMLPLVLMFVVLYFIMIRPQMRKQKEHRAMIEALAKGDEVVIGGGMLGRVTRLAEQYLHVEIANGVEVQVQRAAVLQVLPKGSFK